MKAAARRWVVELDQVPDLVHEIRETHRMHQDLLRAELRLVQQIGAIERRFARVHGMDKSSTAPVDPLKADAQCSTVDGSTPLDAAGRRSIGAHYHFAGSAPLYVTGDHTIDVALETVVAGDPSAIDAGQKSSDTLTTGAGADPSSTSQPGHRSAESHSTNAGAAHPIGVPVHTTSDLLVDGDGDTDPADSEGAQKRGAHHPLNGAVADLVRAATLPLEDARAGIRVHQMALRKRLAKLAEQLPIADHVATIHGLGWFGVAQIVGEAGAFDAYANPAKLWKRMGLAVIGGAAQRRRSGEAAIEQGYNPVRRAIMFVIGDGLIKKQNPYRELYLARKEAERTKLPYAPKILIHRRAHRYMEKRLLRDLWNTWRQATRQEVPANV